MSSSKFDIVVYGATGFTGQLVAEYLAAHYKGDATLKWAMAGRSKDKLAAVRDAIGAPADTPLIVADASDPASLKAMVGQTRSVISTVGPYLLYGSELLAACVAAGTDYFDLCGEPIWMRQVVSLSDHAPRFVEGVAIYLERARIYGGLVVGELSHRGAESSFERISLKR